MSGSNVTPKKLAAEIPEVDAFLGNGTYQAIAQAANIGADGTLDKIQVEAPTFIHSATSPRINTFMPHSAYVKVAEGCDQKCTFCIIPKLRGKQRSRSIEDIVLEAQTLANRGVVELNLVAQDLTGYGYDLPEKTRLADLLFALNKVEALSWIRTHYLYPRPFSDKLIEAFAECERVLPYIDMPLQHIADPVLKKNGQRSS